MSETKWTPGPWRLMRGEHGNREALIIHSEPFRELARVGNRWEKPRDTEEANAHLIAAAPDLYAALVELADLVEDIGSGNYVPDSFTTQPARIALAKARGEA